ncbi:Rid family hydrolase [Pseudonocardia acaciae]|uniref:Rid family hydrolase n=1 Tax=Pseudonocardia acaciae TaxID=551276 RepID=UPI00048A6862|nr:Rid family hydrolase [Pseudonocardia acaciae]
MRTRFVEGGATEEIAGYARAAREGSRIAVSGTTARLAPGETLDTYAQAAQALARAVDAVRRLGGGAESVLRTRVYLAPSADWRGAARAHAEVFAAHRPANTMLFVSGLIGDDGVLVEVELDAEAAG